MIRKNEWLLNMMALLERHPATGNAINHRQLAEKQRFIHQHEPSHNVYVIKSGIVKCFITEANGKDYIVEFLGEGESVGEIEAIRQMPAICTVEALTPLSVYVMRNEQFLHFLRTNPDFSFILLELLATRVANTSIKTAKQQLYSQSEILPQLLNALQAQQIRFTKQDLAEYMGISVRSLNRLLQNMNLPAGQADHEK